MFPGMGGLNPKKMQAVMKQMGINQDDIPASKVTIETEEGNIIINNPSVTKLNMQGQTSFQISGDISEENDESEESENEEESETDRQEEDIKTIMEKAHCLEDEARLVLEKANGDLTEALLSLE